MSKTNGTSKLSEKQVPELARSATGAAYRRAKRAGSVVVYRNGELRKIDAGGKSRVVKKLEPRPRIAKGSKFKLKPESA